MCVCVCVCATSKNYTLDPHKYIGRSYTIHDIRPSTLLVDSRWGGGGGGGLLVNGGGGALEYSQQLRQEHTGFLFVRQ